MVNYLKVVRHLGAWLCIRGLSDPRRVVYGPFRLCDPLGHVGGHATLGAALVMTSVPTLDTSGSTIVPAGNHRREQRDLSV